MINLKSSAGLKLFMIFGIGFFLWIGTFFVGSMINERLERSREVSREIGEKWGGSQTVSGRVITVSYLTGDENRARYVHLLPDSMQITANMTPEVRRRSIYSTVLYSGNLRLTGSFDLATLRQVKPDEDWQHGQVVLNFGLTDIIGLSEGIRVVLNGEQQQVYSGVINADILPGGFHSRPETGGDHGYRIDFDIEFGLHHRIGIAGGADLRIRLCGA